MNYHEKPNELVHSERAPDTHPIIGHEGTAFEQVDASVKMVILSLFIIAGILVVSFAITIPIQRTLNHAHPETGYASALKPGRVIPPEPRLEVHPWDYYPELLASQEKILHSAGKLPNGSEHIPIDQAINEISGKLPIRPDAPPGLTTPGGQGLDFSGSLANMPAGYQPPTIQGEIRKNAQPQVTK
jgi:hypothetical protein